MWSEINNADVIDENNNKILIVDFSNLKIGKTTEYGNPNFPINIKDVIDKVEKLYQQNFTSFKFCPPDSDELIVINVKNHEPYTGLKIINGKGKEHGSCKVRAKIFRNRTIGKDQIVLPYPLIYYDPSSGSFTGIHMSPSQAIFHEIGHWYFDQIGTNLARKYGKKHRDDLDIVDDNGLVAIHIDCFENRTEMAANYCEEYFNWKKFRDNHTDRKLLNKLDKIIQLNSGHPLRDIIDEMEENIKKYGIS